ncbi:alpha/beta fold hydrolase [Nocardia sp. NPDC003482]
MGTLAMDERGGGPAVVLVHGGAGPRSTWAGLESLAARWTLLHVYRRGFGASPPPPDGRQDFDVDADDLIEVFAERRPHVVAHSYGGFGVLLAAARCPDAVRSVTIIETPLYFLAPDDPGVIRLKRLGDEVLTRGPDADPAMLREFLALAGAPDGASDATTAAVHRAWRARLPGGARPDLGAIRAAGIPAMVASGDHLAGLELICDRLADALGARRIVAPGAGHFVAAAPGFADTLAEFLAANHR